MAGMGKTGTVNIFPEMMDEAIKAIKDYRTIAFGDTDGNGSDGLDCTVKKEVETLTSSDFTGSASKGFVNFYTNNIEPATGSSLKGALEMLESICKSIKSAIPDTEGVDEQLGTENDK